MFIISHWVYYSTKSFSPHLILGWLSSILIKFHVNVMILLVFFPCFFRTFVFDFVYEIYDLTFGVLQPKYICI